MAGACSFADDDGAFAAMLALHLAEKYLDQLFVAPEYQGNGLGDGCLPSRGYNCLTKSGCAACARMKGLALVRARRLCVREEEVSQTTGFMMKFYRWRKG